MRDVPNPDRPRQADCSRRGFLRAAAVAAGGAALGGRVSLAAEPGLRMRPGQPQSPVVEIVSSHVVENGSVHPSLLQEMMDGAIANLADVSTIEEAWRRILRPDDIVGLKFNRSAQAGIGTTPHVARALIAGLNRAGWPSRQIVCIEAPPDIEKEMGTTPARIGYASEATDFDSGADHFALALSQITALIDIPFLKTHNIAGMTGSLKNLSHGLIKHPARYHDHGCSPYIGDIVAAAPIRSKLRLCLVDALRVVYHGGPELLHGELSEEGMLLVGFDPVAVDTVGLSVLNDVRRRRGLPKVARSAEGIPYLAAAHRRNLGVAVWHGIDRTRIRL